MTEAPELPRRQPVAKGVCALYGLPEWPVRIPPAGVPLSNLAVTAAFLAVAPAQGAGAQAMLQASGGYSCF